MVYDRFSVLYKFTLQCAHFYWSVKAFSLKVSCYMVYMYIGSKEWDHFAQNVIFAILTQFEGLQSFRLLHWLHVATIEATCRLNVLS